MRKPLLFLSFAALLSPASALANTVSFTTAPSGTTAATSATFAWSADAAKPLRFTCKLDAAAAAPCTSPATRSGLAAGSHRFAVRAYVRRTGAFYARAVRTWTVGGGAPPDTGMPVGDLPGWHQVFTDDFTGTSLDSAWGAYEGTPGGTPRGEALWDPSHVVVHDGMAELQSYRDPAFGNVWTSGGMSSASALKQAYGKYLVRFRMDDGHGIGYALLLWPSDSPWPAGGEIDFAEDGGENPGRHDTSATLHYGSANNQIQKSLTGIDLTQWHTLGVEWTPGHLVYTMDGQPWATVASAGVPTGRMELDLQTQACLDGCPDATTPSHVNMQVDWVVAYAPAA